MAEIYPDGSGDAYAVRVLWSIPGDYEDLGGGLRGRKRPDEFALHYSGFDFPWDEHPYFRLVLDGGDEVLVSIPQVRTNGTGSTLYAKSSGVQD
jgi:hypothetical protein